MGAYELTQHWQAMERNILLDIPFHASRTKGALALLVGDTPNPDKISFANTPNGVALVPFGRLFRPLKQLLAENISIVSNYPFANFDTVLQMQLMSPSPSFRNKKGCITLYDSAS